MTGAPGLAGFETWDQTLSEIQDYLPHRLGFVFSIN
jgi:hypothetical protein